MVEPARSRALPIHFDPTLNSIGRTIIGTPPQFSYLQKSDRFSQHFFVVDAPLTTSFEVDV
jgi:hypothetical protein